MAGKVLALSGGGYRGLYTVRVLQQLEERIGQPLGDHFDLITGTSIGGIIALGIAAGIPLKDIEKVFLEHGDEIFLKSAEKGFNNPFLKIFNPARRAYLKVRSGFRSIHEADGLKAVLDDLFGDLRLKDLASAYVAIPASNLSTGQPKMFKTPHHGDIYLDRDIKAADVALATSAAPVYFPLHEINTNNYDKPIENNLQGHFADGALMGNAPGLFGWIEAKTRLNIPEDEIMVLAIGTLGGKPSLRGSEANSKGALFWLSPPSLRLLTFLMYQQESLTDSLLNILVGEERYHLIDNTVSDEAAEDLALDNTSANARNTLMSYADKDFADFTGSEFCKNHFPRKDTHNAK